MPELLGYADELSVEPGQRLPVRVSSSAPEYQVELVRLIHADASPHGPGIREEIVDVGVKRRHPGRVQVAHAGSYVLVPRMRYPAELEGFTLQLWALPTRAGSGSRQVLVANRDADAGFELALTPDGRLELGLRGRDGAASVCSREPLPRRWCFVVARYDERAGGAGLAWRPRGEHRLRWEARDTTPSAAAFPAESAPLTMAAAREADAPAAHAHLDGRLSNPALFAGALSDVQLEALAGGVDPLEVGGNGVLAAWDFGRDFAARHVHDRSPAGLHGDALNLPMRAVTGPAWQGREMSFAHAPREYAAIHFHADDLEDAGWEVDFELELPDDLRSGVYAARLRVGELADDVPFVVRPRPDAPAADTLLLLPTFTYLAYANERMQEGDAIDYGTLTERRIEPDPLDAVLREHPELGLSLYDSHADGSGVCYSSSRRPILNMRPRYRMWLTGAPRHLGADLYLVDWLEAKGFAHDVAADGDLDAQGRALLDRYAVVMTGSHPEYWTESMRAALAGYLNEGGRCMYLGGNGFYWVTSVHPEHPHVIEVRRGQAATRCWESEPGECHHCATGEPGGIWRHRGSPPNELVGVGFSAQGSGLRAPGYVRCPDAEDPRVAFVFDGVEDEVIGDFGLVMGGAAGDELDRMDHGLGSPPNTLLLATSRGRHDDGYLRVHEEQLIPSLHIGGASNPDVGADMTYFENAAGGAVFSVGSINWAGSLSHAGYVNNVSQITENVLRQFVLDGRVRTMRRRGL